MLGWIMTGAILFGIVELAAAREQWRLRLPGAAAWP
jgi:hypothetical protein